MSDSERAGITAMQAPERTEREALRDKLGVADLPKFVLGQRVVYRGQECTITGAGIEAGDLVYDNSLGHWGYEPQYEAAP